MARLEIFWSFRSPYSYLATDRLLAIKRDYKVDTALRLVRPIALRERGFFTDARRQMLPYMMKDAFREATRLELSISMPDPDPVQMNPQRLQAKENQPYMDLIMPLGMAACNQGRGLEFAGAMARRIWSGVPGWNEEPALIDAAADAGLTYAELAQWASENDEVYKTTLAENEAAHLEHHWGVPLMVLDGEPFFGQDRIETLKWRLDMQDLRRASPPL